MLHCVMTAVFRHFQLKREMRWKVKSNLLQAPLSSFPPSPAPSGGRGRHALRLSKEDSPAGWPTTGKRFTLFLGERARVRGHDAFEFQRDAHPKNHDYHL